MTVGRIRAEALDRLLAAVVEVGPDNSVWVLSMILSKIDPEYPVAPFSAEDLDEEARVWALCTESNQLQSVALAAKRELLMRTGRAGARRAFLAAMMEGFSDEELRQAFLASRKGRSCEIERKQAG